MRPEVLCQRKTPMIPSGIEAATFRLVTQCLNLLHHRVPPSSSSSSGSGSGSGSGGSSTSSSNSSSTISVELI